MPQTTDPNVIPTVAVTAFELLRAATGNPINVSTLDGRAVELRLPTVEEFTEMVVRARAGVPADQLPPMPTVAEIENLVAPLAVEE
jgi:hypothetical protein